MWALLAHSTCAAILVACGLEPHISLSPCYIGSRWDDAGSGDKERGSTSRSSGPNGPCRVRVVGHVGRQRISRGLGAHRQLGDADASKHSRQAPHRNDPTSEGGWTQPPPPPSRPRGCADGRRVPRGMEEQGRKWHNPPTPEVLAQAMPPTATRAGTKPPPPPFKSTQLK